MSLKTKHGPYSKPDVVGSRRDGTPSHAIPTTAQVNRTFAVLFAGDAPERLSGALAVLRSGGRPPLANHHEKTLDWCMVNSVHDFLRHPLNTQ
jgi:hypothetical protein